MARHKPPAPDGWARRFAVPIKLPAGGTLETLDDARRYLLAIPRSKYTEAMGDAADALVKCAAGQWDMMLANGWTWRAVHGAKRATTPQPKPAKVYRIL